MASPTSPTRSGARRLVGPGAGLLVALAALACHEPPARPRDDLLRRGSLYLDPATLEPYSGAVFTTFEGSPDRIEQRASLREGHYDGPFEWYSGEGQLALRELYRDGTREGPYEWYFESGRLYERGSYVEGLREGPYEAYYESGDLHEKGTYWAGAFHGPRAWYLDHRLIEVVTYAHGRVSGPYERYTAGGEIELRGTLRDGLPCGAWLEHGMTIAYPACEES